MTFFLRTHQNLEKIVAFCPEDLFFFLFLENTSKSAEDIDFLFCCFVFGKHFKIRRGPMFKLFQGLRLCRGALVCTRVLGWRSQQKVSSEETHKGAEACFPDDFISFSWHPYWCSGNITQHYSHRGILIG